MIFQVIDKMGFVLLSTNRTSVTMEGGTVGRIPIKETESQNVSIMVDINLTITK
jgi:hypothetical protein